MPTSICFDEARRVLADMIAIRSVNPMGREFTGSAPVERGIVEYLEEMFRPYGVVMERQTYSAMHENLLIRVPGESGPHTLLESHIDTVPADDWAETAFTPRFKDGRLYGRGACDDKGPLAGMALAVRDILESGALPPAPIDLLAAGDEEYAQTGIKYYAAMGVPLRCSVVGEATDLAPVVQHNGTVRWDIVAHGRSAHTSRPELGRNAILGATEVIRDLQQYQTELRRTHHNPLVYGPTITVTMIRGGRTRNAVPDECVLSVDYRVLPGMDPAGAREGVIAMLAKAGHDVSHGPTQLITPPLSTSPQDNFCKTALEVCRHHAGRASMAMTGAPWGTDAAWVADRAPSIVLGPGTTATAHAIDEFVDVEEVVTCARIYRDIAMSRF